MIVLNEQFGYKNTGILHNIDEFSAILGGKKYKKSIQRGDNKSYCYNISHFENDKNQYRFETSYFVGVDWIVENKLPIYVQPKLNNEITEINYLKMLFEALKQPDNFNHLDQLCDINFEKPLITIRQEQDLLSPLLIVQYLHLLKKIVQKGLKKSYYPVVKNLNAKVKGKILVNATIKGNLTKSKILFNYCKYDEFGLNSIENKVLKKALMFSQKVIQNLNGIDAKALNGLFNYIQPAFVLVEDEIKIEELKTIKPNPLYKEYELAIKIAKLILKRYGYTISNTTQKKIQTPPFWIDMSKLFELYVYAKLKERFPERGEVIYHKKFNYLEPDFILNSQKENYKMVVDAKYKPQYQNGNVNTDDIRQVSGYARLKSVYNYLNIKNYNDVIDCLIVFSEQSLERTDLNGISLKTNEESNYVNFYKIGIKLPTLNETVTSLNV